MDDILKPVSQDEFNSCIESLGPWGNDDEKLPPIVLAVSGGADSLCLALLASRWRRNVFALIVDHGIRSNSAIEAALTQERLKDLGIESKVLTLDNLKLGAALEERARIERYKILIQTCCKMGSIDLLLGHHAGDQAETVLMRIRAGSGEDGIAAMAAITDLPQIRLIRPLLSIAPQRLRITLKQEGIIWVEDPSNQDLKFQRNQVRKELSSAWTSSGSVSILLHRSREESKKRMKKDQDQAVFVTENILIRSEGFAYFSTKGMDERTLGALIRTISGSVYAPLQKSINRLVQSMRKVTLGGVQIMPAGRLGNGWLMIRETTVIEKAKMARPNTIWDYRFRVIMPEYDISDKVTIAALGKSYKQFSCREGLPVCILKTLPAFWHNDKLLAVPHLGIYSDESVKEWDIVFQPRQSLTQSHLFSTTKLA